MQTNYKLWTYHNYLDKEKDENEDNYFFLEGSNVHRIALADGAGGVGIYCKDWSKKLADSIPESYECVNQKWFIEKSKEFFEEISIRLPINDFFVKEKFFNQGSYSTLLYAWIEQSEKKLYCLGTGDTYLFLFRKKENHYFLKEVFPSNNETTIDSNPALLNWRLEVPSNTFVSKEYDLEDSDVIIACTDSIARWIFMHLYLFEPLSAHFAERPSNQELELFKRNSNYSSINELLKFILSFSSNEAFIHFLKTEVELSLLEPDDFTLFTYIVL